MEWYWYLLIGWVICFGITLYVMINTNKDDEEKSSKVIIVITSFVLSFLAPFWIIYFFGIIIKSIYDGLYERKYGGHIMDRH
ncbi:hypothetical protein ABET51_07820 [Metabacillus fastidiosus]|uniref:hypothetical protein n=1 Tax=Metabacillus fastidiosus TaxID=1458 RepID=UPI002E1E4556|nr:hypothetical protein [Metabacillus fastidiosus]